MNLLLFSGSLRAASLNKKLLAVADAILKSAGHQTDLVDLKTLAIPLYDGDVEAAGMPDGVKKLGDAVQSADAIVVASPEYNGSIAAPLKNAIDWLSRLKPMPLTAKPVLLMGASPGALGSIRALGHARAPFEAVGSYVYPQSFGLPLADKAFADSGDLKEAAVQKRLETLLAAYADFVKKLRA